jgi:N-acetylglucosaminyldiphosphoundecaprenol N-acetyl-beta-D-mannosaminyltransferase
MPLINEPKSGELFGVKLFWGNQADVLAKVADAVSKDGDKLWIATVNPEFLMRTTKDSSFKKILTKTSLNVIDGVGLIWAKKIKDGGERGIIFKLALGFSTGVEILRGGHRESLVTGADLVDRMCSLASEGKKSVYFFGGWGDRAERTAKYFQKKYPNLVVVGFGDENFDFATKGDILFVARGMEKQERWIDENLERLKFRVVMGVGRTFDYYSGDLKRATPGWRKSGLEWLYSLVKEPKRWKRQLELPKFIGKVIFGDI